MYGRTRSKTNRISAFVEKTKNDCVCYQIYHYTKICPEIHDLEELWQRELLLKKDSVPYDLEPFKTKIIDIWKHRNDLGPHITPLHITDLNINYPTIARLIKRGDIIDNRRDTPRNRSHGVYYYDGANIIYRDCSIDIYAGTVNIEPKRILSRFYPGYIEPYKSVPKTFKLVTEFYPGYWDNPKYVVDESLNKCTNWFSWRDREILSVLNIDNFEWKICEVPDSKSKLFDGFDEKYYIKFDYNNKKYAVIGFYDGNSYYANECYCGWGRSIFALSNIPKKYWENDQLFKDYDYVMR